jgi:hypothetical protein
LTSTTVTAIVEVKSNVSSTNGAGPATLVKVKVWPSTVTGALCPRPSPARGFVATLYSVVPCGQVSFAAPAAVPSTTAVPPMRPTLRNPSPKTIRTRAFARERASANARARAPDTPFALDT